MKARVYVSPRLTVLDPQGQAIRKALNAHGYPGITEVRQGKFFDLTLDGGTLEEVNAIAGQILANPVIEDYRVESLD